MKLSIIVAICGTLKEINLFFENILNQRSQDFEIIAIINSNKTHLDYVTPWIEKLNKKGKLIFNTKRISYSKSMMFAFTDANGEYLMTMSSQDEIKAITGIEDIIDQIKKCNNPDIIEFPLQLFGLIKWTPKLRIKIKSSSKISEHKSIVAKMFPVLFNKAFKKTVIEKTIKLKPYKEINSQFWFEIIFSTILFSEDITFASGNKVVIKTFISKDSKTFNAQSLSNQWKSIITLNEIRDENYMSEIIYASLYYKVIMLSVLTYAYKNNIMINKHYESLVKDYKNIENKIVNNKYILETNPESMFLSVLKSKANFKKEIKELK